MAKLYESDIHRFEPLGGCTSNPGVWDNGNGGIVSVSQCSHCGLIRRAGSDYTGRRLSNDFGPVFSRVPSGTHNGYGGVTPGKSEHRVYERDTRCIPHLGLPLGRKTVAT